jgi:branched-chain amino acid transport system substrate-binding protein
MIAEGSVTDDDILNGMGEAAVGVVTAHHYSAHHKSERNKKFVEAFGKANGGLRPNFMGVGAYDGMRVIYRMIEAGKGTIDDKSVDAVKGFSWQSPRGPVSIDPETRDIVQNVYIKMVEEGRDGKLYNKVLATVPAVKDPWKEAQRK